MAANDWEQPADASEVQALNDDIRAVTLSAADINSLAVEFGIGVRTVQRWFAGAGTAERRNIIPARLTGVSPSEMSRTDLYRLTLARLLTRPVGTPWQNDLTGPGDAGVEHVYRDIAGALNASMNLLFGTRGNFFFATLDTVQIQPNIEKGWDTTYTNFIDSDRIKAINKTGETEDGHVPGEDVPDWFDEEVD